MKVSYFRLRSADDRVTTVHIHANKEVPKGLLRKIIREDLEMSLKDLLDLYSKYKGISWATNILSANFGCKNSSIEAVIAAISFTGLVAPANPCGYRRTLAQKTRPDRRQDSSKPQPQTTRRQIIPIDFNILQSCQEILLYSSSV